ncbi:NAD(P)/FAD-dependent oxidoreductase [Shewanella corallii]|uniref:NAD(P)/FAD-dependent oxidoreductase n=1 Tax=Shewanella corallii TaxID=560080 RepID=A0ABT0NAQ4_9GAMM|nr:FAD/NAD(P)-binding oxidoreductase [Shewanella corallii]MCL2915498.1 NAD(P)/FAD-dependent oxidoreductase [Shewanella corallii]
MGNRQKIVIIGASHAGCNAAFQLKQHIPGIEVTLLSDESCLPYHRPPLSKALVKGEVQAEQIQLKSPSAFDEAGIELRLNYSVKEIDRKHRLINGELNYDKLILATGGAPRPVRIPGLESDKLVYLRDMSDTLALQKRLENTQHITLVGGGYIGLELAASLIQMGKKVTLVEAASRILNRVTAAEVSDFFQTYHQRRGVHFLIGQQIEQATLLQDGRASLRSSDGECFITDLVVAGIGMLPNTYLASKAKLETDNGVLVNQYGQTSDHNIYAIGDCASYPHPDHPGLRIESVQSAVEQARITAAHITQQDFKPHDLPWFWTDQYDLKMKMAGINTGHDATVLRGSVSDGQFSCFYLRNGVVIAADCVNQPGEFMASKRLIAQGGRVPAEMLSNSSISMKEIITLCHQSK